MNKTTIKRALQHSATGEGFINRSEVKRCMGWGNERVADTLKGLDFIRLSRTKLYDIDEVAARIYGQVERGDPMGT